MIVVTSGHAFMDIDAYGCCVSYAELLRLQGKDAIAASTAPLNSSVTPTIRQWRTDLVHDYRAAAADEYILVDISDPEYFDTFVKEDRIVEIIDHHMDFAEFWQKRLGEAAHIEFVGAACTLVYECWKDAGLLNKMSQTSARLLLSGIVDNTLNFDARVTTQRDREAYDALRSIAQLPDDWQMQYFSECQNAITDDLPTAIASDTKIITYRSLDTKVATGQLAAWDASRFAEEHIAEIHDAMADHALPWFMNLISISEGKSYLMTTDAGLQDFLSGLLNVQFTDNIAVADRLWLRKEIIKADLDRVARSRQ